MTTERCDDEHELLLSSNASYVRGVYDRRGLHTAMTVSAIFRAVDLNVPTSFGVSATVPVLPPARMPSFSPSFFTSNPCVPSTETTFSRTLSPSRTSMRSGEKASRDTVTSMVRVESTACGASATTKGSAEEQRRPEPCHRSAFPAVVRRAVSARGKT